MTKGPHDRRADGQGAPDEVIAARVGPRRGPPTGGVGKHRGLHGRASREGPARGQSSSTSGLSTSCRSSATKSSSLMADQSTCSFMLCGFPGPGRHKPPRCALAGEQCVKSMLSQVAGVARDMCGRIRTKHGLPGVCAVVGPPAPSGTCRALRRVGEARFGTPGNGSVCCSR